MPWSTPSKDRPAGTAGGGQQPGGEGNALTGLKALVTGASSGIGACVAAMLAERGVLVAGAGRDAEALGRVARSAPLAVAITGDLTSPGRAASVVEEAAGALGGLDIVVSNAGAGWSGPFASMTPQQLDDVLDLNLRSSMHVCLAAAPYLLSSPAGGRVVLVGSIAGLVGVADEVAYGTAKAGLRGLADGLRAEWGGGPGGSGPGGSGRGNLRSGRVTVTLVSPGPTATAFFARRNLPYQRSWPRPLPVQRVASSIVSAIEHRRAEVVVPAWLGIAARLNGGVPGLYRLLQRGQGRLPS